MSDSLKFNGLHQKMLISKFLPCDLWSWVTLDHTGEDHLHVLPDCVSSKRDCEVWGLLPQSLQIFHVGRRLFFSLRQREDSRTFSTHVAGNMAVKALNY